MRPDPDELRLQGVCLGLRSGLLTLELIWIGVYEHDPSVAVAADPAEVRRLLSAAGQSAGLHAAPTAGQQRQTEERCRSERFESHDGGAFKKSATINLFAQATRPGVHHRYIIVYPGSVI